MKSFPMFLRMAGRDVIIAGGGEQAAQKARLILKTEAQLILLATTLDDELADLVASGKARHVSGPVTPDNFANAALVFIATGCPGLDAALHALAKQGGAVVNVVDQPALCDATTPSIVDRDPVVVAIGTEGNAPVLGRQIKSQVETLLDPSLGGFAALAGRLRGAVAARVPRAQRRAFWRWAFDGAPRQYHARGAEREAAKMLKAALAQGQAPDAAPGGSICLVGAGPGAADLLTLRAVQRLQEADVIYYDRLVDPAVLELARRDAERVYVGKEVGAHAWPQDLIDATITAAARSGKTVVRLKSGDPSIFGRAEEELSAARAAGIPTEIVPGITAASAGAAASGRSLTQRGSTDRVILSTATCQPGSDTPDIAKLAEPGATLVLYMAVHKAAEVSASLMQQGISATTTVEIMTQISRPDARTICTTLDQLEATIIAQQIQPPALLVLRFSKLEQPVAALRIA